MNYPHLWTGSDPNKPDDLVHVATTGTGGVVRPACDRDNVAAVVTHNPATVTHEHLTCAECAMLVIQDPERYVSFGPDAEKNRADFDARAFQREIARALLRRTLKPARHAVGRLSAAFDQIKAAADEEDRELTEEEWGDLRGLADDLDGALGGLLGDTE